MRPQTFTFLIFVRLPGTQSESHLPVPALPNVEPSTPDVLVLIRGSPSWAMRPLQTKCAGGRA